MITLIAASILVSQPGKVVIQESKPGSYQILRNGKPFFVKGAGAEPKSFAELQRLGANSVRTWGIDDKTIELLDAAQKSSLTVTLGFWMRKSDGFSYKNKQALDEQANDFRKWVRKYKDHPSLLMWAVGNEVEIGGEWPEIWIQTERLARIAKEEDPNHPVMSVLADMWPDKMDAIHKYCPSIDILGINSYSGLPSLESRMKLWKKPYLITEYHFSLQTEDSRYAFAGMLEPSSLAKAESAAKNYRETILAYPGRVLGGYFFYWGRSNSGPASFHATHLDTGEWLPVVRKMSELWGGNVPKNRPPVFEQVEPSVPTKVKPGDSIKLLVNVTDPDGDPVDVSFWIVSNDPKKRFVGDHEQKSSVFLEGKILKIKNFTAPKEPGPYRILLVARDGKGAASTYNIGFGVE